MRNKDVLALREIVNRPTERRGGSTAAGSGLGFAAWVGNGAATAVLGIGAVFVVGWPIVMLCLTFGRYFSVAECLAVIDLSNRTRKPHVCPTPLAAPTSVPAAPTPGRRCWRPDR
jgi:hypothetical protein